MKTVLLANNELTEAKALSEIISQQFDVSTINSMSEFGGDLQNVNLVLVDCNFTPMNAIDLVAEILKTAHLPILIVTPPSDAKIAAEALRAGAYNYIVKTPQYHEIVNIVIGEAIHRFDKYEQMRQTILDLQKRIDELEQQRTRYAPQGAEVAKKSDGEPTKERRAIFNEILSRFKKGDINLPSPPQIQTQFEEMIQDGAGIQDIAKLLKQDVSICSKLISISNSAYYGGINDSRTLEQAIGRIGLNATKKYIHVIYNRSLYATQEKKNSELMEKLWRHSLSCGLASQSICEMIHLKHAEEVFTMGLIHDITLVQNRF